MDDIVREFLVESHENLDRLDRELVALEKDPNAKDTLADIFRTIHTIKGGAGFLGFGSLETLAHAGENLLSKLRDGVLTINPECAGALLAMVDAIRFMLGQIEETGQTGDKDFSDRVAQLTNLSGGEIPRAEFIDPGTIALPIEEQETVPDLVPEPMAETPTVPAEETWTAFQQRNSIVSDSTVRVDVGLLDKLMNLVGELVLARNQVLQFTERSADGAFLATSQRLNSITTELQESVMKTRLQPIGNVWSKLPRVVRDIASACGKQVRLEMEGREIELDRTIIEAIKDPLTHIVRNAVDHGIEPPEVREARGKPVEGCLRMRAFHEGGQVTIEIEDDGGGVDFERVRQKAMQKGLITLEQAARMSEHESINLLFLPGFSTTDKVTHISGRGVGMDVVKSNIEKIGGTVDLQSQLFQGATIRIKIPLTLAIIPALIVASGGERFAIPQVSLVELARLEAAQARKEIEYIHGTPVYRLRGKLLPLAFLNEEFQLADPSSSAAVNIIVLQAEGRNFGLIVDEIRDTEEIVVKPVGKQLKGIGAFAGATIMGDGRVALILDVVGLAQRTNITGEVRDSSLSEPSAPARKTSDASQTLLLFDAGQGSRMAVPLSSVARLEEFCRADIEHSGPQEVVRYRGQILPLIRVSKHLPAIAPEGLDNEPLQVVVYSENGRSVGLVVGQINDIVQEHVAVKHDAPGHGILGSVVIQDKVTDLLDVQALIRASAPADPGKAAA